MDSHQKKSEKYSIFTFYRYLDRPFVVLQIVGLISAVVGGTFFSGGIFLLGKIYAEFVDWKSDSALRDDIEELCWVILIDAGLLGLSCCMFFLCLHLVGQKVSYEFRWRYMKSILTKDTEWYEANNLEELPTKVHTNLNEIENSSGKTIGFIIYSISACLSGITFGLLLGAVYCCCFLFSPIIVMMIGGFNMFAVKKANEQDEKNFIRAGADIEQALNAIKIIKAFGQERYETDKFIKHLSIDQSQKIKFTFLYALSVGIIETVFYYGMILAFIIAGGFVIGEVNNGNFDRNYRIGDCLGIFWCIQYGTYCFGNSFLNIEALQRGIDSLKSIMEVIDHIPSINVDDDTLAPINSVGNIEYKEVSFQYKSRDNPALRGIDLNIRKGKITALVGESGSGKSTAVKLLSRLYDPTEVEILVDGQDLKTINLRQYRRKISYVSQEPSLFNESIKENLLNGNPYASDAEIEQALKICMAYGFIQKLPEGINTNFGEIGGILSGGQKQRIALARAVLRKPDLLILDEATSALDTKNEKKVQEAIENVSREYKMTTVVIAHRLNTIRNADIIYVLDKGQVIEVGTHEELIRSNKTYADFYKSQQSAIEALQIVDANLEANNEYSEKNIDEDDQLGLGVNQDLKGQEVIMSPVETSIKLLNYTKLKMYVFISLIGAIYVGCSFALISIPFAKEAFNVIHKKTNHEKWKAIWYLAIILGSMTVAVLIVQTMARYYLRRTTDLLSINMRSETFKTLIKQPIQFFYSKINSIESLIKMLASDIRHLNGNSVEYYLLVVQGVAALICGIVVGFCYCWRTALFLFPVAPLMSIGFTVQYQLQFTPPNKSESSNKKQLGMVSDCIMNYQTIASLAYEDEYLTKFGMKPSQDDYRAGLFNSEYINIGNAFYISIIYGFSQAINHITYVVGGLSMAERIDSGKSDSDEFLGFHGVMLGAFVMCNAMMNSPNFAKGKMVASKILSVISNPKEGTDLSPIVDGTQTLSGEQASQDIEFHNVWFKYPLENSKWVLRSFNLTIKGGHTVGLVGESGSGKSTVVQLLLRFYDPQQGYISIGGINIKEFTISSLRSMFGLIQQEPILFNTSVMENIIYGKPDANSDEIVKATTMSNSHEFICTLRENPQEIDPENKIEDDPRYLSLDEGYKASCGSKGSKLSGGQKQRIAIARALVRNPSILLLDEATSALDEKNQQKVQDALDDAAAHKTCIVIAHRTSTLKKCDKIYRIAEGAIIS